MNNVNKSVVNRNLLLPRIRRVGVVVSRRTTTTRPAGGPRQLPRIIRPRHPRSLRLCNADELAESNYTIIAIDFASRYCVSRVNSANAQPNLKTDSRLVGMTIQ